MHWRTLIRNFKTRIFKLEAKQLMDFTEGQDAQLIEIILYLDNLAKLKASGDADVQNEIEMVNKLLKPW